MWAQGVLDGFNATVFAYGCTGAGKTYTMIGNGQEGHQGIMVLTLQDLFKQQRRVSRSKLETIAHAAVLTRPYSPRNPSNVLKRSTQKKTALSSARLNAPLSSSLAEAVDFAACLRWEKKRRRARRRIDDTL